MSEQRVVAEARLVGGPWMVIELLLLQNGSDLHVWAIWPHGGASRIGLIAPLDGCDERGGHLYHAFDINCEGVAVGDLPTDLALTILAETGYEIDRVGSALDAPWSTGRLPRIETRDAPSLLSGRIQDAPAPLLRDERGHPDAC